MRVSGTLVVSTHSVIHFHRFRVVDWNAPYEHPPIRFAASVPGLDDLSERERGLQLRPGSSELVLVAR